MNITKSKSKLKPYNAVIQVCPDCGKIDVYKDDNHECDAEYQNDRQENLEYYD